MLANKPTGSLLEPLRPLATNLCPSNSLCYPTRLPGPSPLVSDTSTLHEPTSLLLSATTTYLPASDPTSPPAFYPPWPPPPPRSLPTGPQDLVGRPRRLAPSPPAPRTSLAAPAASLPPHRPPGPRPPPPPRSLPTNPQVLARPRRLAPSPPTPRSSPASLGRPRRLAPTPPAPSRPRRLAPSPPTPRSLPASLARPRRLAPSPPTPGPRPPPPPRSLPTDPQVLARPRRLAPSPPSLRSSPASLGRPRRLAPTPPAPSRPRLPALISQASRQACVNDDGPSNTDQPEESAQTPVKQLTRKQEKAKLYSAQLWQKNRQASNIKYSGETRIRAHVSNSNPNARIRLMRDSFICWADPSHDKLIAVIKFHPFSAMDPALKAQYEFLSQHLISQTQFQNANKSNGPAYSGKMYSLGWRKAFEANTKVSIQGISDKVKQDQLGFEDLQTHVPTINRFIGNCFQSVSQPLFDEVKKHHEELKAPGLAPHFERDPDSFTSHLSFTIGAFANTPHMDTNASPFSFVMWIPIETP
ncbi:hypothetical protein PCANC_02559 [Puccinia coronata f. sp. avenae]|uniref:Tet-like 2OG-Fe(II) oxygenase domain-containing protein n=1 Tax=Puccinia coronata f. sp. avenae TaxID=200324 RepID=A0A2N5VYN6_9BASI|nr:hypothetical protein PCASD_19899 [Puccinia coronata f. sp. avenae]PLW55086.1 hypothetical protein PCANC_02559 [Puccinia coronata f. sp. avenae]